MMRALPSCAGAAALACTLLLIPPLARAAAWNGSYSADGRCYCSGALPASLASRIVPTPLGGQSVAKVCARIGAGPGLDPLDGRYDRVVYADAQCGHGPFTTGETPPPLECAGTLEPGSEDCRARGPRWDLAGAYARRAPAAAAAVASSVGKPGFPAALPAAPILAAATVSPASDGRVVAVEGKRWRQAPPGTPESGPPGSRIVLDGQVFLDADAGSGPVFAPPPSLEPERVVRGEPGRRPLAAPHPKRDGSPEAIRARQQELLTEARARLRRREMTPALTPAPQARSAPDAGIERDIASESQAFEGALDVTTEALADGGGAAAAFAFPPALRVPSAVRSNPRRFGYVEAMSLGYDYGGGGVMLEGSAPVRERYRLLARVGAAADYRELLLGASWYVTPLAVDRLTLVLTAGVETGRFELEAQEARTELADSGLYLSGASHLALDERFGLQAGFGYSSFFDGDPIAFGGASFHATPRLDVVSRFELGDNDSLGIGVRYHY